MKTSSFTLIKFRGIITASAGILALLAAGSASRAQSVIIQYVTVGNPGNPNDTTTGFGNVGQAFQIGKYDVTDSQYVTFLNAVDPNGANALGLFKSGNPDAEYGIKFTAGAAAGAKYSVKAGYTDMPVADETFWDAVRFANWLNNGQGQASTETGAYTLLGGTPSPSNGSTVTRNAGAKVWVPSQDEWYKAAYYDPTKGVSNDYWLYATRSDSTPGNVVGSGVNVANFFGDNGHGTFVFSVTQSASFNAGQNYLTAVGSFTNSPSFYGTFDQAGDVSQWNDTMKSGGRVYDGGGWDNTGGLKSSGAQFSDPTIVNADLGFRVASVPPSPMISSTLSATGTSDFKFDYLITASNFPSAFNATGLPRGLHVNRFTGLISGTPTASGTFSVTISASNGGGSDSATLTLVIDVNFFNPVKGSYTGLASVGGTDTAFFTLSLNIHGGFTGKLILAGAHYPLKGTFATDGTFDGTLVSGTTSLDMVLTVDPGPPPSIVGTITATTTGGTTSYTVESGLLGTFKASTIPPGLAGKYTAIMPPVSGTDPTLPDAPGYGTMSVSTKGAVRIAGKLGDGTPFTAGSQLHADGMTWTLFQPLYGKRSRGSIAGDMVFESSTNSDCDGVLDWTKPAQTTGAYYRGPFSVSVDFLAAKYAAPPLATGSATFMLGGGDLPNPAITDSLTILPNSKVIVSGTDGVILTLSPKTGAFGGHFPYPVTNKKTPFGGVIYQKPAPEGFGLFLGTDQSGTVNITP